MDEAIAKWVLRIQVSRANDDVVNVVRQYLSTWTPSEIGEIPADVWPGEDPGRAQICELAVEAKRVELTFGGDVQALTSIQELAAVLTAASTRFGQLGSPFFSKS